jgi:hypothetical protein
MPVQVGLWYANTVAARFRPACNISIRGYPSMVAWETIPPMELKNWALPISLSGGCLFFSGGNFLPMSPRYIPDIETP